jgi:quinol-cytochrome oxidoreductase complex cytochrome b subunit
MYLANGRDWGDTLPRDITAVFKMARIVCVFMWFVHILGCLWNLVGLEGLEKQNWRYQYSQANSHFSEVPEWYLTSLYQTFLMMLGDQNAPVSNTEVRTNAYSALWGT